MGFSRNEDILQAMIDGTDSSSLPKPQSREERLLHAILDKMNGGGGGGGGGGLSIYVCASNEYNHGTGVPTIENPSETTIYLVPIEGTHQYSDYNGEYNILSNQNGSQNAGNDNVGESGENIVSDNDLYQEWVYIDSSWEKFGSGSHVTSSLASLSDVMALAPQDGQTIVYDSELGKWKNVELRDFCFADANDGTQSYVVGGARASDLG